MPNHITKRRTTTNLKTINNQNCQKIELYGSPTTKEFIQTGRRGRDWQLGQKEFTARPPLKDQGTCGNGWQMDEMAGGRLGSPTFVCG